MLLENTQFCVGWVACLKLMASQALIKKQGNMKLNRTHFSFCCVTHLVFGLSTLCFFDPVFELNISLQH